MTAGRYLLGILILALIVGPVWFAARRWRARWFPDFSRAWARLVETILFFTGLLAISQILGTIGLFRRWPMAAISLAVGLIGGLAAGPRSRLEKTERSSSLRSGGNPRQVTILIVAAAIALVLLPWVKGMSLASREGVINGDSAIYHLPKSARYFQTGSLTGIQFIAPSEGTAYHPGNSETIHALGMLAFGTDFLSPFLNLGWLLLLLLAIWCVGSEIGSPIVSVGAVLPLLVSPLVRSQGGSADNDVVSVFFLVAAVALLLRWKTSSKALGVAAFASGLALGTKLTMVVPIVVLTIGIAIIAPTFAERRFKTMAIWFGGAALTGSFWYLRNFLVVGNPIPALRIGVGKLSLPKPPMELIDKYGFSVFDYLFDAKVWKRFFMPGLNVAFGKLWPILILAPLLALALGVLRGKDNMVRMAAAVGLISFVAYVFTPTTALGSPGHPWLFVANLRYLLPPLVLGSTLAPATLTLQGRREIIILLASLLAIFLTASAPVSEPERFELPLGHLLISFIAALVLVGIWPAVASRDGMTLRLGFALLIVIAAAGGYWMQRSYIQSRYMTVQNPAGPAFSWAQGIAGARIGYAGFFMPYPLYGRDLSNRVEYVGNRRKDGSFMDYSSCPVWRRAVNSEKYDYLVLAPPFEGFPEPSQTGWTRADPSAHEILTGKRVSVFRINKPLDPSTCPH